MRRGLSFVVLHLLVASVVACTGLGSDAGQGIMVGNQAKDFALKSLDGSRVSLNDYRGQAVLINFWATWCPPCEAEIPEFEEAFRTYAERGFVLLGVNEQETREEVARFVAQAGITYPVLLDERALVLKLYRVPGLPTSILVDRDGVIRVRHIGSLTSSKLEEYLVPLLPGQ